MAAFDIRAVPLVNVPDYEIQALHELFSSTNGSNWQWRNTALFGPMWIFVDDPEPCVGPWQGITCTTEPSIDGYLHVTVLDVHRLGLSGTLPPTLFHLTHLETMNLRDNHVRGTIPTDVGKLGMLTTIDFGFNHLTGELPADIANCTYLRDIILNNNTLSGAMPESLSTLPALLHLDLTDNMFSGQLPAWIGKMQLVSTIALGINAFHGTIPDSYGNLTGCKLLRLGGNYITGTLPGSLVGLRSIREVELSLTHLRGQIPSWIGQLTTLLNLFLNNNHFTGVIPETVGQLQHLEILNLCYNKLNGSIPSSLSNLEKLKILKVNSNQLHGQIPASLTNLVHLESMDLSHNRLFGPIPPELGSVTNLSLSDLIISGNALSGTIPASLGNLNRITVLDAGDNVLRGTIPPELGKLGNLMELYLRNNFLTGTMPPELSNLGRLITLFAQDNRLSGSLNGVFNASQQRNITLINLGNNVLTGTVPEEIAALPNLLTLVMVENCFSGVRLDRICDCQYLTTLVLDGLRSAKKCRGVVLPGISNAYVLTTEPLGTVPPCLFSMPNLNTLHLSSNSLTGSLPGNVSIASPLFDLSLSHNKLTGAIPESIQTTYWFNLDLSYNKLGGEIIDGLGAGFNSSSVAALMQLHSGESISQQIPPSALSLRNNRLSNRVPASLSAMINISVVSGNLFTCNDVGSDLPSHDNGTASYHCGSKTFDRSYYLWIALVGTLGVTLLVFSWWLHTVPTTARGAYYASLLCSVQSWYSFTSWYTSPDPSFSLTHYRLLLNVFKTVCRAACWVTLVNIVVMLPVYGAARAQYGTHSHEYAWSVSAAFLSGYPALGLLLAAFVVFLAVGTAVFRWQVRATWQDKVTRRSNSSTPAFEKGPLFSSTSLQAAGLYVLYFVVNFAVSFGANALYVLIILRENSKYFVSAQIGLSVFKVCWNSIGAVRLARWTWQQVVAIRGAYARQDSSFFALQLFVGMFNYIAIPCLVVGVISPDCFNTLFVNQADISSTYFYESCAVFGRTECVETSTYTAKTSFVPPFTYSYQCSASLITYYAASFVYMALIVTFVNPLVNMFLRWLYVHRQSFPRLAKRIERLCPTVLRDLSRDIVPYNAYSPYFDAKQRIVEIMTYFGVLLTFGLVFPPLAAAMLVAIAATVAVMKVKIGRFLTAAVDAGQPYYLQLVDSECRGVASPRMLRICAMQLLCFTCFFFTPFLFDTLGDAVGTREALWVVVIVSLLPALVVAGSVLLDRIMKKTSKGETTEIVTVGTAMRSEIEMSGGVVDLEVCDQFDSFGALSRPVGNHATGHTVIKGAPPAVAEDISAAKQRSTEVEVRSKVELGGEPSAADQQEGIAILSALHTTTASSATPN